MKSNIQSAFRFVGPVENGTLYEWFDKEGVLVNRLIVEDAIKQSLSPLCPACLSWRGELVKMAPLVNGQHRCPACGGLKRASTPVVACTCGSSPHHDYCMMSLGWRHWII